MTLLMADVSSHNTIPDWPAFLASVDVLIVKVSEGCVYLWTGAPNALAQGRAAGKGIGAYHFYGGGDPVAEADYFLAHYAWQPGEVPILDWEPTSPPADPDGVAAAFCARVLGRLGVPPIVYMNSGTARSSTWERTRALGCGLWVAQYGPNTGQPPAIAPAVGSWGAYVAWQYTSNGTRPGLSGVVDLSLFYGTAAQWRAYGTPNGADMPLTPEDVALILDTPIAMVDSNGNATGRHTSLRGYLAWADVSFLDVPKNVWAQAPKPDQAEASPAAPPAPVDPAAVAAALAADTGFVQALAQALVTAQAADLARRFSPS